MCETTGIYQTPNGSKYLQQLCKHFAHKILVDFSPFEGTCDFDLGKAYLSATETTLTVRFELRDPKFLPAAHSVIDSHLKKFAFREGFDQMVWQ